MGQTETLHRVRGKIQIRYPGQLSNSMVRGSFFISIAILAAQNLVIFYNHYLHDYGFPWDFPQGYFGIVVYWTSLVSKGYFPTWIPFAQMGYPMEFLFQSGMHYPPFWLFPLLKIQYDLYAAVIFQTVHVFLGAVGMFLFLRLTIKSASYALVGAIAFQFFGGFYSNSEHADIVRAFALVPWFFFAAYISDDLKIHVRHLILPALVLLMATGGYPGNLMSTILILGIYVLAQWLSLLLSGANHMKLLSIASAYILLAAIGVGLSFFHLGPGLFYQDYLYRTEQTLTYMGLGPEFLPGLFLNNNVFDSEISMTSTYITLPMLLLAAFPTRKAILQWRPMILVGLVALVMVAGPKSGFWYLLTKILPPLKLSRFPASDYKIFVAVVLIFFGVLGLKALLERELTWKEFIIRLGFATFWIVQMLYTVFYAQSLVSGWRNIPQLIETLRILGITVLVLGAIFYWPRGWHAYINLNILVLITLLAVDAYRVLPNMITWQAENISQFYEQKKWPLEEGGRLMAPKWLMAWPSQRPERFVKENKHEYAWEGYITGRYILNDKVPYVLQAPHEVAEQPVYLDYMIRPWTPLFFDPLSDSQNGLDIPVRSFKSRLAGFQPKSFDLVSPIEYGINTVTYAVNLDRPTTMVENEIYFPGWTALLYKEDEMVEIVAFPTNGIFRSWQLPAGQYKMVASFEFPNIWVFRIVSIGFFLLYLVVIIIYFWFTRRSYSNSSIKKDSLHDKTGMVVPPD